MEKNIELMIIGGFLGAGKTTTILSVARELMREGRKIGIITNDQGSDLVDTNFLLSSGLSVFEVTGSCFCCNFDGFASRIKAMAENERPDVILAEPVGSCTDLIATIFKPIQIKHFADLSLKPFTVVADPKKMRKMLMESNNYPPEINYLYRKQLEEADVIALNKIDNFSQDEIDESVDFIKNEFPRTEVITISAKENINIRSLIGRLSEIGVSRGETLSIDYDKYAAAEGYLGWLNCSAKITSGSAIDLNGFIMQYMKDVKDKLSAGKYEVANFKIYGVSSDDWCKAGMVSLYDCPEFGKKAERPSDEWSIIINIRAQTDPGSLKKIIENTFKENVAEEKLQASCYRIEAFKPGRPNPTYRYK
jgi:Ni2+-binding GTPase involved in maturation of urease and hydrogenase